MSRSKLPFCCYCGRLIVYPLRHTTEHVVPRSRNGNDTAYNKRPCCHHCNKWRGNKALPSWKQEIAELLKKKKPRPPFYHLYDLEVMIENIDYMQHYVTTAGGLLKKKEGD